MQLLPAAAPPLPARSRESRAIASAATLKRTPLRMQVFAKSGSSKKEAFIHFTNQLSTSVRCVALRSNLTCTVEATLY